MLFIEYLVKSSIYLTIYYHYLYTWYKFLSSLIICRRKQRQIESTEIEKLSVLASGLHCADHICFVMLLVIINCKQWIFIFTNKNYYIIGPSEMLFLKTMLLIKYGIIILTDDSETAISLLLNG